MKTYLETRLQFVGCDVDSDRIKTLLGLDATKTVTVTEAARLVEVQLTEPDGDEEAVMKAFEAWVSDHREGLSAIPAKKRDLVLKRYVPQDHGWSFLRRFWVYGGICRAKRMRDPVGCGHERHIPLPADSWRYESVVRQ